MTSHVEPFQHDMWSELAESGTHWPILGLPGLVCADIVNPPVPRMILVNFPVLGVVAPMAPGVPHEAHVSAVPFQPVRPDGHATMPPRKVSRAIQFSFN